MQRTNILFLSTNRIWAGSEVLWASAAKDLHAAHIDIKAGVRYDFSVLKSYLPAEVCADMSNQPENPGLTVRILRKLGLIQKRRADPLESLLEKEKPQLVVISQGNNSDGRHYMKTCLEKSIPFVTLTHLVTEGLWPGLTDEIIDSLRILYQSAVKNYFVSQGTLDLHEKILGYHFPNSEVVFNPFRGPWKDILPYPPVVDEQYRIALVGRIEIYHKGYDLLIDILKQEKWRSRKIEFSIFGSGPHVRLLKRMIWHAEIRNVSVFEHVENVETIWSAHHLLIMPSRMEGQALSLIEAMHYGRAAIVTQVGGTTEILEDSRSGFVADEATVQSLDDAMERAWMHKAEWEKMGEEARKTILEKHPPDAVAYFNEKILGLINRPGFVQV